MAHKTFKADFGSKECLTVEIVGRGTFEVPLPSSLPISKMREVWALQKEDPDGMRALEWTIDFFAEHLGDVVDDMTLADFNALSQAWWQAGNPDSGESSA